MILTRPATALLLAACACALVFWWWWRGPALPAYELAVMPLQQTVVASGRVAAVSRAQVGAEMTGVVLERRVREGDRVAPGDVMLVLRPDELAAQVRQAEVALQQLETATRPQAELALTRAETTLLQARREAERRRDLTARGLLSREALEQAEEAETLAQNGAATARVAAAAVAPGGTEEAVLRAGLASLQAQLAKTTVRSEVAGTVLTRDVEPGDLVQPGKVLFTVARDGETEIRVPLDEKNLAFLALGQPAVVLADAYPGRPFDARLRFLAPRVDPERGTVEAHLSVAQAPDFLREDMTVSVSILTGRRDSALALPNDALAAVQGARAQVVRVSEGRLQRVAVELGLRGTAFSEVTTGLAAGDRILVDPGVALAEGTRVRIEPWPLPLGERSGADGNRNALPVQFD
ncbi:efflux RND transporter periplasmic adaptor subunit [Haliea sp.]|uniref:efflux RND transporter periplasmic adaptor subunit n=1 Tax=Haliea sp. TaxID=1932666 RepID=UPI0025BF1D06|nr:efflux RND transporter periplasmic adaptor subunit [Haliea sp.]